MRILRWSFAAVYMVQGGLMTSILAETAPGIHVVLHLILPIKINFTKYPLCD